MARAQAIETTPQVRGSGVSQQEYEVRYSKMAGRPLSAAEKEVFILAYATQNHSSSQLYRVAIKGCAKSFYIEQF